MSETEDEENENITWFFLLRYLTDYRKMIGQLLFGLGIGSLLQLIAPFLTQSIVDIGINTKNLNFVYLILIAQFVLIIGRVSVDVYYGDVDHPVPGQIDHWVS